MGKRKMQFLERCSWHKPDNLGYLHASLDAEERLARGERQRQCPVCYLWHWAHEWGDEPKGLNLPVICPEHFAERPREGK